MTERDRVVEMPLGSVLRAFGVTGVPERLPGGEGHSFRVGGAVLKPAEDGDETTVVADLLSRVNDDGFRLARPLRSGDGRWVVEGWSAASFLAGQPGPTGRWAELLVAARAFHAALHSAPRPGFLDRRSHRWALADRVAWGEATAAAVPDVAPLLARAEVMRGPVRADCQLVHGDLSGNVLFADGRPPAIIDFSPYWRPPAYAEAVVVVDGLLWLGADDDLLTLAWSGPDFPQMLVRALIFRLVAHNEGARHIGVAKLGDALVPFESVIARLEALLH